MRIGDIRVRLRSRVRARMACVAQHPVLHAGKVQLVQNGLFRVSYSDSVPTNAPSRSGARTGVTPVCSGISIPVLVPSPSRLSIHIL